MNFDIYLSRQKGNTHTHTRKNFLTHLTEFMMQYLHDFQVEGFDHHTRLLRNIRCFRGGSEAAVLTPGRYYTFHIITVYEVIILTHSVFISVCASNKTTLTKDYRRLDCCLHTCVSVYLSVSLLSCLSVCLSLYETVCLSLCLLIHMLYLYLQLRMLENIFQLYLTPL